MSDFLLPYITVCFDVGVLYVFNMERTVVGNSGMESKTLDCRWFRSDKILEVEGVVLVRNISGTGAALGWIQRCG